MKKIAVLLIAVIYFTLSPLWGVPQAVEGKIIYDYTVYWNKIYSNLEYLTQEERDRALLVWGNNDGCTTKMQLFFSPKSSLYTYTDESENESAYSWRKSNFLIYRDFEENKIKELQEMLRKTYLIEDNLNQYMWRVMNELKEIQGHLCMKAVTEDTVKKQTLSAWFAADIPVPVGPERLHGLPGAILGVEINGGDIIIEASKIELRNIADELRLPRKMKGREINITKYNELITEHIKTCKEAQRYPYSSMRF